MYGFFQRKSFTTTEYFYAAILACYPRWIAFRYQKHASALRRFTNESNEVDSLFITNAGLSAWIGAESRIDEIRRNTYDHNRKPTNEELEEGKELRLLQSELRDTACPRLSTFTSFAEHHATILLPAMNVFQSLGNGEIRYRAAPARQIQNWRDERSYYLKPFMARVVECFDSCFDPNTHLVREKQYLAGRK